MSEYIGQQFGNYRLTSLIGRGGFAEVYLGEHTYLKTQAAIKILRTRVAEEEQENFYAEARTIARLQHEHIVRVLEFGLKDETLPYLVMEYAVNGTLRERFPKGTATPPEALLLSFKQVASALQYAHNENLIHRDIKPENMLLGAQGEVLLSDFGIALIIKSSRQQDAQEVAGTITYMAPEQLLGRPTKASDQYALGIVVYEWLSGERPFRGSFTEIASQHMLTPPPSLRARVPGLSPAIEEVVFKALAKDQQERFASVQDFANALEAAIQAGQVSRPLQGNALATETVVAAEASAASQGLPPTAFAPQPLPLLPSLPSLPRPLPQQPDRKSGRTLSRGMQFFLLALVLLLISSGLAYALLNPRIFGGDQGNIAQQRQALYTQATRGEPQVEDPLTAASTLTWEATGQCRFSNGAMHAFTGPSAVCESIYTDMGNFALQVEMTIVDGVKGGVTFRGTFVRPQIPTGGSYQFTITTQGDYELTGSTLAYQNGSLTTTGKKSLLKLQHSPAIKTGLNQTNLLTVIGRDQNIYLYVNRQYIGSVQDKTSLSGNVGMFGIGAPTSRAIDVVFKNLQLWSL